MSIYSFARLIKKYSGPITVHGKSEGAFVEGKWVASAPSTEIRQAALIPFDVKTIAQLGGLITNADVQLYSLVPFLHGDKIQHDGQKYKVDTSANFMRYGDFYRYIAKGVSSFD